jgi:hypothetical protein
VYLLKDSPVGPLDLIGALARPAGASLIAGAIVYALRFSLLHSLPDLALILVAAPVFGALYAGLWIASPGGRRLIDELLTIREAAVS